jgi:hypothetical protein
VDIDCCAHRGDLCADAHLPNIHTDPLANAYTHKGQHNGCVKHCHIHTDANADSFPHRDANIDRYIDLQTHIYANECANGDADRQPYPYFVADGCSYATETVY